MNVKNWEPWTSGIISYFPLLSDWQTTVDQINSKIALQRVCALWVWWNDVTGSLFPSYRRPLWRQDSSQPLTVRDQLDTKLHYDLSCHWCVPAAFLRVGWYNVWQRQQRQHVHLHTTLTDISNRSHVHCQTSEVWWLWEQAGLKVGSAEL